MESSAVLIVTICSNHKTSGGSRDYDRSATLMRTLPGSDKALLRERRREACSLLLGQAMRYSVPVQINDYNRLLDTKTFEFGYTRPAEYLPAIERYSGRFYGRDGMASDGGRPSDLVRSSPHHLLIVSGLYGLLCSNEPIQRYSLNISDHPSLREVWVRNDALTALLLSYCRKHGIMRVFDLCGCESYRSLVRWDRVMRELPCGVLHAFSRLNAGGACLPALGNLARNLLRTTEDELLTMPGSYLRVGDEEIALTVSPVPPDDWPREDNASDLLPLGCDIPWWQQRDEPCEVTSGPHTAFSGGHVHSLRDVDPIEARRILELISRMPEVMRVRLGRFRSVGSYGEYSLVVDDPRSSTLPGQLTATLRGPTGVKGSEQDLVITVQAGCESMVAFRLSAWIDAVAQGHVRSRGG